MADFINAEQVLISGLYAAFYILFGISFLLSDLCAQELKERADKKWKEVKDN